MREYEVGEFYDFIALYIESDSNNVRHIVVNGGDGMAFRVKPFDFQTEWSDLQGATISCYCDRFLRNGMPHFEQSAASVLKSCYAGDGEVAPFTIGERREDGNTGQGYYIVSDAFGLNHRFYTKKIYGFGAKVDLRVRRIIERPDNRSFLELKGAGQEPKPVAILKESRFGQESEVREFKSTIVFPAGSVEPDIKKQVGQIVRVLASFMNAQGGTLYIGVNDCGQVCGIEKDMPHLNDDTEDEHDYQMNCDGYEQKIRWSAIRLLGQTAAACLNFDFRKEDGLVFCAIKVSKSERPVFFNDCFLFERQGNMCLLLKGEAVTNFIVRRLGLSAAAHLPVTTTQDLMDSSEPAVGNDVDKSELVGASQEQKENLAGEPAACYITFYDDGGWSYQAMSIQNSHVVCDIPVGKSLWNDRTSRLVQCYDNGCMNVVSLAEIKKKTKGKIYKNGWNTDAVVISAFCASQHDQIVFFSKDEDERLWVKIHYVTCVGSHISMSTKGNIIINPRFENAKIICAKLIDQSYQHLVTALVLKDSETSTTLGFKAKDAQFKSPVSVLKKLCDLRDC